MELGGNWTPPQTNFDNVMRAMMTLFELATLEQWPTIMHLGVDATPHDQAPVRNYNQGNMAFFMMFVFVGYYMCMNLFTALVIDNLARKRAAVVSQGGKFAAAHAFKSIEQQE
mgnify:CR=1 FL=1